MKICIVGVSKNAEQEKAKHAKVEEQEHAKVEESEKENSNILV
jgi:hypothetical protein